MVGNISGVGASFFKSTLFNHSEHLLLRQETEHIADLVNKLDEKFDRKFDQLSSVVYELKGRMDGLENRMEKLENRLDSWQPTIDALKNFLAKQ